MGSLCSYCEYNDSNTPAFDTKYRGQLMRIAVSVAKTGFCLTNWVTAWPFCSNRTLASVLWRVHWFKSLIISRFYLALALSVQVCELRLRLNTKDITHSSPAFWKKNVCRNKDTSLNWHGFWVAFTATSWPLSNLSKSNMPCSTNIWGHEIERMTPRLNKF